jgi:predicted porin
VLGFAVLLLNGLKRGCLKAGPRIAVSLACSFAAGRLLMVCFFIWLCRRKSMFQKKMLVLAALMGATAAAQADVKAYGYLELGVGSYKSAGGKSITQVSSGNMMTSFLGFAGSEDLGGGMKAEFALETFIAPDTGATLNNNAGNFWGRGSFVALTGAFGKLALGQYDTPTFVAGLSYNPFGSSMMFSPTMRHYYGLGIGTAVTGSIMTIDTGWVNSLTYETPDLGGFMATLQWSPKESTAPNTKDSTALGLSYNAGPLSLMATASFNGFSANTAYAGKQYVGSLNASYDFGVVKGFLQYTKLDNKASNIAPISSIDGKAFQIGASVPVTNVSSVKASYGQYKKDNKTKNTIFSLGYDYALSKRTGTYVAYSNEKATRVKSGTTFAVGIKHSF